MRTDLFDFDLPEDRIALEPAEPRDAARLLVVRPSAPDVRDSRLPPPGGEGTGVGGIPTADVLQSPPPCPSPTRGEGTQIALSDQHIRDLPALLRPGDALVVNDTRVIRAALTGERVREDARSRISFNLHKRIDESRWRAFARPAKRLKVGDRIHFGHDGRVCLLGTLEARVTEIGDAGEVELAFSLHSAYLDEAIEAVGDPPLPPYIASKRAAREDDAEHYQTMFARREGAVAAPTAGLHFTPRLMDALAARGIARHAVTLHVGAGTFLPVKAQDTAGHRMHAEWGEVTAATAEALNAARARGGRIVAIGTTALRLLESAADDGGRIHPFAGETDIFITPGYRFRAVDLLLTNFHLPRSTLFMLVAAFSGLGPMQAAYAHAIREGYRFYSYGDACLLHPQEATP